jgi:hypothetical protein
MISALVAMDLRRPIERLGKGNVRHGAGKEDVKAVKKIVEMCLESIR